MTFKGCFSRCLILVTSGLFLLASGAQAESGLDVTMRMVTDNNDLTGAVVQEIQLPDRAVGARQTGNGQGPSSGKKMDSPAVGQAQEARESGRRLGESVAESAREKHGKPDLPPPPKSQGHSAK